MINVRSKAEIVRNDKVYQILYKEFNLQDAHIMAVVKRQNKDREVLHITSH